MTHSKYQMMIFETFQHTSRNLAVIARAGSGKSYTTVEATKLVPIDQRAIVLAFNSHIAKDIAPKLPMNVESGTINAIGWRICRQATRIRQVDKFKTWNHLQGMVSKDDYYRMRNPAQRLVSLLKAEYARTPERARALADVHDIRIPENTEQPFWSVFNALYRECIEDQTTMDFDDQVFMPLYHNYAFPKYDVVFVDEAQDLNPVQIDFVQKLGRRIVAIGDDKQAIYAFRGADVRAIPRIIERLDAQVLSLPICYRCPKAVVAEAQKIVPDIEAAPDAKDGLVDTIDSVKYQELLSDGDYVLCRTTAPLVAQCLRKLRDGIKATVKGRDIGDKLIQDIDNIAEGRNLDSKEFWEVVKAWEGKERERYSRTNNEDALIRLEDTVAIFHNFVEVCDDVLGIKQKIQGIFSDNVREGIIFSTIHRSKGLEKPRVFIIHPELLPHPAAKSEEQLQQEMNLKYVAITRAQSELYWVR